MSAIVHGLICRPHNSLPRSMGQAAHHGVDLSQPVHMAILEMEPGGAAYFLRRLQGLRGLANAVFDEIDDSLVFLCGPEAASMLLRAVSSLVVGPLRQSMTGVVSELVDEPSNLVKTYSNIKRCLRK